MQTMQSMQLKLEGYWPKQNRFAFLCCQKTFGHIANFMRALEDVLAANDEVTSYNEWGEGTQIEPAKKHRSWKGHLSFAPVCCLVDHLHFFNSFF